MFSRTVEMLTRPIVCKKTKPPRTTSSLVRYSAEQNDVWLTTEQRQRGDEDGLSCSNWWLWVSLCSRCFSCGPIVESRAQKSSILLSSRSQTDTVCPTIPRAAKNG